MSKEGLQNRRRELEEIQQAIQRQLDESETESVQALSAYDNHPADLATDTFYREVEVGLSMDFSHKLDQLRQAQDRVAKGGYGVCEQCGRPIDPKRLAVIPEALLCVQCQQEQDPGYLGPPAEVTVVPDPFGDAEDLAPDSVEMVGEDFWQAVAQFGTSDTPQDTPPAVDYGQTFVGFDEPTGSVTPIEEIVDTQGDVLFERVRPHRHKPSLNADGPT